MKLLQDNYKDVYFNYLQEYVDISFSFNDFNEYLKSSFNKSNKDLNKKDKNCFLIN